MPEAKYYVELATATGPDPGKWTDITDDVYAGSGGSIQYSRGRDDILSVVQPGMASFSVVNDTGKYSPANTSSALYPHVDSMRAVRITAEYQRGAPYSTLGALQFDGVDDIGIGALNLSSYSAITVEFWLKWEAYTSSDDVVMEYTPNYNSNTGGFVVFMNASNLLEIGMWHGGSYFISRFAAPSAAAWHHVTIALKRGTPTSITLYIDGAVVSPTASGGAADQAGNFANSSLHLMGRAGPTLSGAGVLDEFRLYSRILTAAEVADHYNGGLGRHGWITENGLVLGLHFNEGSGTTLTDYSENAIVFTCYDGASPGTGPTFVAEHVHPGFPLFYGYVSSVSPDPQPNVMRAKISCIDGLEWLQLAKATPAYTTLGTALSLGGGSDGATTGQIDLNNRDFSIVMWLYVDSLSGTQIGLSISESSSSYRQLRAPSIYATGVLWLDFYGSGAGANTGATTITAGAWTHVAMTFNHTTKLQSIYLDGILRGSNTAGSSFLGTSSTTYIGTLAGSNGVDGAIDQLTVFQGHTLSAAEITTMYNGGAGVHGVASATGLQAGWHFNEGSGTSAADYSGNSHTATLTGSATWRAGKVLSPIERASGTMVGLALDEISWPVRLRTIDDGNSTIFPAYSDQTIKSQIEGIGVANEAGLAMFDAQGKFVYEDRHHRLKTPHLASGDTFTDTDSIQLLIPERPSRDIHNEVKVTHSTGSVTAIDATSIAAYGTRRRDLTASFITALEGSDRAHWTLSREKDPRDRPSVTIYGNSDAGRLALQRG